MSSGLLDAIAVTNAYWALERECWQPGPSVRRGSRLPRRRCAVFQVPGG